MTGQTARSRAYHQRAEWERRRAEGEAEVRHHVDYVRKHYLYRCYDADGRLLYIGCTQDIGARMQVHASSWQNPVSAYLNLRMTRFEAEEKPYAGKVAGRKAEREAIAAEAPLLNQHHNKGRGLRGPELEAELRRTRPPRDPALMAQLDAILEDFGRSA